MEMKVDSSAVDATVTSVASKVTYSGAGASVTSWFLSSEFGILLGLVIGVAGFVVNWYYSRKKDRRDEAEERRAQELHEIRMEQMRRGIHEGVPFNGDQA